jgi:uncharacterized protein YjbJ (UPF0337 family)
MNADQFKGRWAQFKGELKKQRANITDDDLLQIEGDYQKFQGKLQAKDGDRKEEVSRWVDDWFEQNKADARTQGRSSI